YKLSVLKDDKHVFPPYQGAPLVRKETLKKYPELEGALNKLAGKISDDEMREMNYKVNAGGISPKKVAEDYLKKEKLIK
ncbi:glycine/betaine ABC transporter permease, partial [Bacillus sp. YC2]|uniref:glycine betaine ABC transporter substrate-binding protein n=1 Tax=Bacillus sp. YC2 TaxID=2861287 RepID=UPI001DA06515